MFDFQIKIIILKILFYNKVPTWGIYLCNLCTTSLNRKVMIWCGFFRLTIAPFTTLDKTRMEKFEIAQCATRLYRWWGRFDHLTESMRLWLCWISHHFPWLNWTTRRELNDRFRCCEVKLKLVAFCVWVRSFGTAAAQC